MTTQAIATRRNWRVVDIVVAALIAVAGGVIFWAWDQGANLITAFTTAFPPGGGLYVGGWLLPGVLAGLIIRKPGAALFVEVIAACSELVMGSQYGLTVLASGAIQGLGAEIALAIFLYRKFNLPVGILSGALAGLGCSINDNFMPWGWNIEWDGGSKALYTVFCILSGAVIAGALSWLATRGLAKTGALSAFASRKAGSEPAFR
ncbi:MULTISPECIES: ECF transporter S component [Arthrobacter]|uniref:ECF transporter S component n=2 Tax=Arthrobacter TaxID=1663 RepID=A0ABU9KLN1_9MICC|nr:ECF transporter S component [Arthrobacter sp. YJM1]MDP5226737.1 ECF transporter S component [Arthrobacter sp. YJM1]